MTDLPTPDPRSYLSVHETVDAYRRKDRSPVEVIDEHLDRITTTEPFLNAFVVVATETAKAEAKASAERWARGEPIGELDGVPVTVKDLVAVGGLPTRSGTAVSDDTPAADDDPVVARMREAGAIVLGKTTTSEFGWKGITDTPAFGTTRNPWNLDHSPGGSSGGAAASLAAGIAAVAHGNDGGGSIRIPSSYSGHYGIKPTFGRVPQPNEAPYGTLTANGPLARNVADAALLLNVMSRPDVRDWCSCPYDDRDWRAGLDEGVAGLRIAYTDTLGDAKTSEPVRASCRAAIDALVAAGAQITEVGTVFEPLRPRLEPYWKAGFSNTLRSLPSDRWSELDPGFRQLAQEGLAVAADAVADGYTARAQLAEKMRRFHQDYDLLLTPTTPTVAPAVDMVYHSTDFDRWDHAVPFTVPFNYTGQPAGSVPVGFAGTPGKGGLPVGMQVVASHWREDLVLRGMHAIADTVSAWS